MDQSAIGQRIKFLMDSLNLKVRTFAQALHLGETNIRNYLDKGTKPSSDVIEKISHTFPQVNLVWLITGQGEPFLVEPNTAGESTSIYTKKNSGNAIGTNHGVATQSQRQLQSADLSVQLEAAQELIQQLRSQLKDKEHIIELLQKSK